MEEVDAGGEEMTDLQKYCILSSGKIFITLVENNICKYTILNPDFSENVPLTIFGKYEFIPA
jgi:hypothetical protein